MKTKVIIPAILALLLTFIIGLTVSAQTNGNINANNQTSTTFITYDGKIVDSETSQPLIFANIGIKGNNIATVSNTDGFFSIKIPNSYSGSSLEVSYIGYESLSIPVKDLKTDKHNVIKLKMVSVNITEISVIPNNPKLIIEKAINNKLKNYPTDPLLMKAFYRETIKKRRNYVGISEAVAQVYKQSYSNLKNDMVRIIKNRKSADVEKMDTILFKLQGGPYSTLLLDVVKDPYVILSPDVIDMYEYTYVNITKIDGRLYYVIDYKQKEFVTDPLFAGRMHIDIENFAISSITFSLNTENKTEVANMFIKRKPMGVKVEPTRADYMVQYKEKDGKWYFNYSRGEVNFKVKWDKKLFNTTYSTMVEMAITDREPAVDKPFKPSEKLRPTVIMSETATDFSDNGFWGEHNTIEPEQSIQSAIKKISRSLEKVK